MCVHVCLGIEKHFTRIVGGGVLLKGKGGIKKIGSETKVCSRIKLRSIISSRIVHIVL